VSAAPPAADAVGAPPGRWLAVALLSAATLAYQILLVRVFAIEHFHHLASLAIGVAMLGFGAAGVLLARGGPPRAAAAGWFVRTSALATLALAATPLLTGRIALDPTRLVWDAAEWPRLAAVVALLAVPFLLGALAVLLALLAASERPGRIYGASFLGSGFGAMLALAALWLFPPGRTLAVPALVAALGSACAALGEGRRPRSLAWAGLALAAAAWAMARPASEPRVSPYKGLPQVEAYPDARRVAERASPVGWLVALRAPAFRHAPGLSLAYQGPFPEQTALFVDGETIGAVVADPARASDEYLGWLPTALPYALGKRERVLLIGPGGDTEVRLARAHGARRVVAVELHPEVTRLARAGTDDAKWVVGDARGYVARTRERFDLIVLGAGGTLGGSAAGVHGLSEDFLHTVEAYRDYLRHLSPDGVLAVTHWLAPPPRASVRAILTAVEALRGIEPAAAGRALVISHSWGTATVLVKPSGFGADHVEALRHWADARGFDLDWWPRIETVPPALNALDEPVLYRAARAAAAGRGEAAAFASRYAFDVAPATDARPYPHHFLRPASLPAFFRERGGLLPFAEWGFVALVATATLSAVLAALAMLVPAALGGGPTGRRARLLGYFGAIGVAYMAAEIAVLQPLGLLLGHPVYALAASLASLLVFSGWGSLWSDRLALAGAWRWIAGLAALLTAWAFVLLAVVHALEPAPLLARAAASMVALGPLGFLMGVPFPVGWRTWVGNDRHAAAWAWAANGFASVVAAPLAALLALEAGWRAPLLVAALAYAAAAGLARGLRSTA